MIITSGTIGCRVAKELGLELVANSLRITRRGPCGSAKWAVPDGLLRRLATIGDPEYGVTNVLEVVHGPHAGRKVEWFSGSYYFHPYLRWAD